jgi:hypothetical protein
LPADRSCLEDEARQFYDEDVEANDCASEWFVQHIWEQYYTNNAYLFMQAAQVAQYILSFNSNGDAHH